MKPTAARVREGPKSHPSLAPMTPEAEKSFGGDDDTSA